MQAYRTKSVFVTYQYTSFGMSGDNPIKSEGTASVMLTMRRKGLVGPRDIAVFASMIAAEIKHDHIEILNYKIM